MISERNDRSFFFDRYHFEEATATLTLSYSYEAGPTFEELIVFPPLLRTLHLADRLALDQIFRLIFLLAGVSYYKMYAPLHLECRSFPLDKVTARFIETTYLHGLAEFAYRNGLNLHDRLHFNNDGSSPKKEGQELSLQHHCCVPIGGGKDSIVTVEYLKKLKKPVTLFAVVPPTGIPDPIRETAKAANLPLLQVTRILSPTLLQLNQGAVLNGHVPITAIISAIAVATALLRGWDTVVMSNERSANHGHLTHDGVMINHQYSKSFAFEKDFAQILKEKVVANFSYFSLLRPFSEVAISRRFAHHNRYHALFRSCNRSFRQDPTLRLKRWCGDCAKCRFVFLALAPFLSIDRLTAIFGKNLLDDPMQKEGFARLCGLQGDKPFECVGEVEESSLLLQRLHQGSIWQHCIVVRELGPLLEKENAVFTIGWEKLFCFANEQQLPPHYLEALHEDF